jgi:hypothetical protein
MFQLTGAFQAFPVRGQATNSAVVHRMHRRGESIARKKPYAQDSINRA